jgi:flagellar L-ring protein precursor FlgH
MVKVRPAGIGGVMVLAMLLGHRVQAQTQIQAQVQVPVQSNSLFVQANQAQQMAPPPQAQTWPAASVPIRYGMEGHDNPSLQANSLFAVQLPAPRIFKVHDLVTIVINEQRQYKHDADLETKKDFDIDAKLDQWFRIHDHSWYQQTFPNGNPEIKGTYTQNLKDSGDHQRTDQLTTRITVEISDIKPNGTLMLRGHKVIKTDDEEQNLTLTGTCRAEDVGPDNTILSTQVHDLNIDAQSKGAVRDATQRGWLDKLIARIKAF